MHASFDEAMDVIKGWANANALLNGVVRSIDADFLFSFGGYITELAPDGVVIRDASGSYSFTLSVAEATEIDYQDPSEAPADLTDWAIANLVSALILRFATGDECILSDVKT
jgi:hypothetical protein